MRIATGRGLTAPSVVRSESATVSRCRAENDGGLDRRRVTAPGREEHHERNEPNRGQPRLGYGNDDDEQREVMKPDQRGESERGGQRDDERASVVTAPAEKDDGDEEADPE